VELDRGRKKAQAKKQETVSALALDEVGMEEAFRAGKPYTFEIPYEWAAVYPSEKLWRETFYSSDNSPGGLATAVLHMPKMASLYIALSFLDRKTVSELLSAVNLKTLYDHYADLLYLFAPAFSVQAGHAAVPGGPHAEQIWERLAVRVQDSPALSFVPCRTRQRQTTCILFHSVAAGSTASSIFTDHSLALNNSINSSHPQRMQRGPRASFGMRPSGFPAVHASYGKAILIFRDQPRFGQWQSRSSSDAQTAKLLKKSPGRRARSRRRVLLRLAETRYKESATHYTELDNFLAVSRIDAHRTEPLDEEAVLLLAQHYSDSSSAYAYFTDLTSLSAADFREFFAAVDRIRSTLRSKLTLSSGSCMP